MVTTRSQIHHIGIPGGLRSGKTWTDSKLALGMAGFATPIDTGYGTVFDKLENTAGILVGCVPVELVNGKDDPASWTAMELGRISIDVASSTFENIQGLLLALGFGMEEGGYLVTPPLISNLQQVRIKLRPVKDDPHRPSPRWHIGIATQEDLEIACADLCKKIQAAGFPNLSKDAEKLRDGVRGHEVQILQLPMLQKGGLMLEIGEAESMTRSHLIQRQVSAEGRLSATESVPSSIFPTGRSTPPRSTSLARSVGMHHPDTIDIAQMGLHSEGTFENQAPGE